MVYLKLNARVPSDKAVLSKNATLALGNFSIFTSYEMELRIFETNLRIFDTYLRIQRQIYEFYAAQIA